jgi:uncharacterized protein (DUF983 family)
MAYTVSEEKRPVLRSLLRGLQRRCPACGIGKSFKGYVTLADSCSNCEEPLGHIQADDIPPYFTILIVGHIVVPSVLLLEQTAPPPFWVHMAIWPALTLLLTLAFLPRIKGAIVNLLWALRIRGDES